MEFTGFDADALTFLREVRSNNSKAWFEANRERYRRHLLEPFRALVTGLGEVALDIDAGFEVRPEVNRTISRIYRDTRFSRDKSPLRDHLWLAFKRPGPEWQDAPAYFFELAPDAYRFGMGYYAASPRSMDGLRRCIDADPEAFLAVIAPIAADGRFLLAGDDRARALPNPHAAEIQPYYRKKSLYLVCTREPDELLFSESLLEELASGFHLLSPLYRTLRSLVTAR